MRLRYQKPIPRIQNFLDNLTPKEIWELKKSVDLTKYNTNNRKTIVALKQQAATLENPIVRDIFGKIDTKEDFRTSNTVRDLSHVLKTIAKK